MYLHEEYIQRHELDVPLIQYNLRSKILLKRSNPHNWRVLSLDWQFDWGHPGFWYYFLLEPIHSSYKESCNWHKVKLTTFDNWNQYDEFDEFMTIYWDQYDKFIKDIAHNHTDWMVCENSMEKELFYWEVFVYVCDNWIAENDIKNNQAFIKNLFLSLDQSLSLEDRWENFQKSIFVINQYKHLSDFYKYNICNYLINGLSNDSSWFARLIEYESKKIYAYTS